MERLCILLISFSEGIEPGKSVVLANVPQPLWNYTSSERKLLSSPHISFIKQCPDVKFHHSYNAVHPGHIVLDQPSAKKENSYARKRETTRRDQIPSSRPQPVIFSPTLLMNYFFLFCNVCLHTGITAQVPIMHFEFCKLKNIYIQCISFLWQFFLLRHASFHGFQTNEICYQVP